MQFLIGCIFCIFWVPIKKIYKTDSTNQHSTLPLVRNNKNLKIASINLRKNSVTVTNVGGQGIWQNCWFFINMSICWFWTDVVLWKTFLCSPESGVGAGIDSYYEYVLKAYILLGDDNYLDRFNKVSSLHAHPLLYSSAMDQRPDQVCYLPTQQWIRGQTKYVILQLSNKSEARPSMLSYSSAMDQRPDQVCYLAAQQWIRGQTKYVILQLSNESEARPSMLSYSSAMAVSYTHLTLPTRRTV